MEKVINYLALVLIVLFIGIYISREVTKSEYRQKLDQIEAIKDSMDTKLKLIDDQLEQRDELLKKQINASRKVIQEVSGRIEVSEEVIDEFENEIESIIEKL